VLRAGGCPDFGPNDDVEHVIRIMHFCHVGAGSPGTRVDMMGRHGPWRNCFGACLTHATTQPHCASDFGALL